MTRTAPRITITRYASLAGSISRPIIAALFLSNLVACAVTPGAATPVEQVTQPGLDNGITGATDLYNSQDYSSAIEEYDKVIKSSGASANERRLAHLGKALVYLGNDENWHSLDNAKLALVSAGQVVAATGEEFAAETDLLMGAVTDVIGTESKYIELQSKTGNSSAELGRLKKERDALKAERDQLLKEQKALNEALEKLKSLTLGD
ncbi:MAG: hypothetical protein OQJ84_01950 [Xanthomonadales bacterium]|nr:hypothetical protein [Xanthomonadales bacterium]